MEQTLGGWKTETQLALTPGWDAFLAELVQSFAALMLAYVHCYMASMRTMVKNAIAWATKRGLSRQNEVHGTWEYRVPTEFNFSHSDVDRLKTTVSGTADIQARPLFLSSSTNGRSKLSAEVLHWLAGWPGTSSWRWSKFDSRWHYDETCLQPGHRGHIYIMFDS